jgi:cold shock CspA family protein
MFEKGELARWFDEKGFGFIKPENGQRDIFIHISALINMSRHPIVGDVIYYQVSVDDNGKPRAINAKIEGVPTVNENPSSWSLAPLVKNGDEKRADPGKVNFSKKVIHKANSSRKNFNLIPVLFLIGSGIFIFSQVTKEKVIANNFYKPVSSETKQIEQQYQCQGKIWCSQMTSCEEATFYQNNCPGTKMDGDSDGVPCESQWCG